MDLKKGFANDTAVVAIGLIAIIVIAVWVINANAEYSRDVLQAADATNAVVVQQRDAAIRRLVQKIAATSVELAGAKKETSLARAELDTSKKKLDSIKAIVQ